MRRRFIRLLFIGLLLLIGVIVVNTVLFSSRQIQVEPAAAVDVDEAAIGRLSRAIQIPTVSSESGIDSAALRDLDTYIHATYPLVDSLLEFQRIGGFSQVFKWPGKNAKLTPVLFMAHLDIVPVTEDSRSLWRVAPFSGEIRDGYIYGRGTLDDKASAFGWLETVEQLLREGYQPERTVYLAFGHDEELSGRNGAQNIARYFQEQNMRFAYVLDEGLMIVEQAMPGLAAPVAMVGIAEKGYVTLRLKVQLSDGGHSSMPPRETAITVLGDAIRRLQDNPFPVKIDGATRELFQHAGPEMSLPVRAVFANLGLTSGLIKNILLKDPASAAMLRTTTAPTMINGGVKENVLPTEASAILNFRILPGETVASVQKYVQKTIDDDRVAVVIHNAEFARDPSPLAAVNSFGFQVIHKTVREVIPNAVVAPGLLVGATDSYHFLEIADDIYRFQPVTVSREEIKGFHGINERLSLENYRQMIRFYRQLLINSCK